MLQALPLVFVLIGLTLYSVLGGADFGAGVWQLLAGPGPSGRRIREHAHHSMAPVWEANHVWLIFVLTVFWTAYPRAFGAIGSTLPVPLFIAALGIIFRGAAYALRAGAASDRESSVIDTIFSLSSILTPFALGAAAGAIASDRVYVAGTGAHLFSSWLNATSIFVGVLAVSNGAYLAAVYLAADAARLGHPEVEQAFRRRALGAGVTAGAVAAAGLVVVNRDSHPLFRSLVDGTALAPVIVSCLAGAATLALVYRRRYEAARYGAAVAVAAVIAGWALSRWPTILPGLSIDQAAAGHDTLVWVVVAVLAGATIVFPSLALLFSLTLMGRFQAREAEPSEVTTTALRRPRVGRLARAAAASLVAGFGLLTIAEAPWEHAIGLACLLGAVLFGFAAITSEALTGAPPSG